jgi:hypothetical protein
MKLSLEAVQFLAQHLARRQGVRHVLPTEAHVHRWLQQQGFSVLGNESVETPVNQPGAPAPARRVEDRDSPDHPREPQHPNRSAYQEQQAEADGPGQPGHHTTVILAYEAASRSCHLAEGPLVQFLELLGYSVECADTLNTATEALLRRGGQRCVLVTVWTLDVDGPSAQAALSHLMAHAHGVPSAILLETDPHTEPVGMGFSSVHRTIGFQHSHVGDALLPLLKWLRTEAQR